MLEEFRHIAETAVPQPIQNRMVTADEAQAVLTSFNRLTDDMRLNFLALPVDNIIEFSLTQAKKRPSLHTYMNGVKETKEEPPPAIPATELDRLDEPATPKPEPIVEKVKPKRKLPAKPHPAESYFTRLTERLEKLPSSITVDTSEHVERLAEIEHSMLDVMTALVERIGRYETETSTTNEDVRTSLALQREMIQQISETQAALGTMQAKLIESQSQIAKSQAQITEAIVLLAEKVGEVTQTPPVVNIPAPIVNVPAPVVNVTVPEGRRTKVVERDANNLISRITESYE